MTRAEVNYRHSISNRDRLGAGPKALLIGSVSISGLRVGKVS